MRAEVIELSALIDELERLVDEARVIPLTIQVRFDREEVFHILDRMRTKLAQLEDAV